MADRFYTPSPLAAGEFALDGPEAHHLAAVRRFGAGDRVTLFNGDGHDYPAVVVAVGKRSVVLSVGPPVPADRELGFPLVVASAMPKGDRADFLVEKLTELGVTRFVPLVTARSVVQPKDAKHEKLARQVIEASKQCGRNVLMAVEPVQKWDAFAGRPDLPACKLLLHPDGDRSGERHPSGCRVPGPPPGAAIAVGPEGGLTPDEVAAAVAHGWRPVTLGRRVLRTETAALAAAAWAVVGEGGSSVGSAIESRVP